MSGSLSNTSAPAPLRVVRSDPAELPLEPVEPTDSTLIAAVRSGDVSASATLFARHYSAALRAARRIGGYGTAEDLTSEAFLKVLGVIQRGGGPTEAFKPYLMATIRHLYVDVVRKGTRELLVEDFDTLDNAQPDGTDGYVESSAMAELLASLPTRWREILWWTVVRDQPLAVAAAKMGINANAAAQLSFRARRGLAQAYDKAYGQHELPVERAGPVS